MRKSRLFPLCLILGLAGLASPAAAGCQSDPDWCYWRAHQAISHAANRIAYLEANPNADESFKGPVIEQLHAHMLRVRAAIGPRWPHWPTPCCYSRKPLYLR
jgi:hypothetical protein